MNDVQSIYNSIKKQYLDIRLKHARELEDKKNHIRSSIPEFAEIENSIIDTSMDYSRKRMAVKTGSDEHKKLSEQYKSKLLELRMAKNKLLIQNGYNSDYLEEVFDCDKCLDTGFIDGQKCICYKLKEVQLVYGAYYIDNLLSTNNFSNLSRDYYTDEELVHFDKAVETCHNFINNFNSDYRNLLFYGKVGTGKSFLSGCIAKELIDKGLSVVYFSSNELFRAISDYTFSKDRQGADSLMSILYECDLLVIDDLGTEYVNDFIRNQLFNIINERILRQKSLIISTNLSLEGIRENYTDRVLSRLYDSFEIIKLSAKDIRLQKKLALTE